MKISNDEKLENTFLTRVVGRQEKKKLFKQTHYIIQNPIRLEPLKHKQGGSIDIRKNQQLSLQIDQKNEQQIEKQASLMSIFQTSQVPNSSQKKIQTSNMFDKQGNIIPRYIIGKAESFIKIKNQILENSMFQGKNTKALIKPQQMQESHDQARTQNLTQQFVEQNLNVLVEEKKQEKKKTIWSIIFNYKAMTEIQKMQQEIDKLGLTEKEMQKYINNNQQLVTKAYLVEILKQKEKELEKLHKDQETTQLDRVLKKYDDYKLKWSKLATNMANSTNRVSEFESTFMQCGQQYREKQELIKIIQQIKDVEGKIGGHYSSWQQKLRTYGNTISKKGGRNLSTFQNVQDDKNSICIVREHSFNKNQLFNSTILEKNGHGLAKSISSNFLRTATQAQISNTLNASKIFQANKFNELILTSKKTLQPHQTDSIQQVLNIDCDELCLKGISKFQIEKDSLVNDGKKKNAIYVKSKFKEENNNNDII